MIRASSCFAAALLGVFATPAAAQIAAQVGEFRPVTDAILTNPDPADWLMISRTFDQQRYSPLDQINKGNVGQLRMAWSRGLPNGTQESTPIVYRGVMYLYAPGASIQAVDATNGDLIWEYQRDYPRSVTPAAARSKSLGIYEDMIHFAAPGDQGRRRRPDGRRLAGRRRQGHLEPHLRAEPARELLYRGP